MSDSQKTSSALPRLVVLQCAAVMIVGTMFYALGDSVAKFLAIRYPVWEIIFIRYATHLFLFLIFLTATKRLKSSVRTTRPKLQLVRSALLIGMNVTFFLALRHLPLAEAMSLFMLAPLMVCLLAVPFLGETIGKHRVLSVAIGIIGALILLRPGGALFQPAAIWALLATLGYAFYLMLTRMLADSDSVATTTLYTAIVGFVISGILAPFNWQAIEPQHVAFACFLGVLAIVAHGLIIIGFTIAPASLAAVFDYVALFWGALFGLLFFAEFPDAIAWCGIATIVASGVYLLWRETHHKLPPTPRSRVPIALTDLGKDAEEDAGQATRQATRQNTEQATKPTLGDR